MNQAPIFVGDLADRDAEHEEAMRRAKRCGPHPSTCPDCPENICWLCQGSGRCKVAAVDAHDGAFNAGVLAVDDREVYIPCVACHAEAGGEVTWRAEPSTRIRFYGPDDKLLYQQEIAAGTSLKARPHAPLELHRFELLA